MFFCGRANVVQRFHFLQRFFAKHQINRRQAFFKLGAQLIAVKLEHGSEPAKLADDPRDGLTTGLVRITGWRIGWARTAIEVAVLCLGWWLGGVAGVGTVLYALANGPLVQWFMARFEIAPKPEAATAPSVSQGSAGREAIRALKAAA